MKYVIFLLFMSTSSLSAFSMDSLPAPRKMIEMLLVENSEIKESLIIIKEELNTTLNDNDHLTQQLKKSEKKIAGLQKNMTVAFEELENSLEKLAKMDRRIKSLSKDSSMLRQRFEKAHDLNRSLESKLKSIKDKERLTERSLFNKLKDLEVKYVKQSGELQATKNKTNALARENEKLEERLFVQKSRLNDTTEPKSGSEEPIQVQDDTELSLLQREIETFIKENTSLFPDGIITGYLNRLTQVADRTGRSAIVFELEDQLSRYNAFVGSMKAAQGALAKGYLADEVNKAKYALMSIQVEEYAVQFQNLRGEIIGLLNNYYAEYCALGKLFSNFNKLSSERIVLQYLDKYELPDGSDYVNPAYEYLHRQLARRRATPLAKEQPFDLTNCN